MGYELMSPVGGYSNSRGSPLQTSPPSPCSPVPPSPLPRARTTAPIFAGVSAHEARKHTLNASSRKSVVHGRERAANDSPEECQAATARLSPCSPCTNACGTSTAHTCNRSRFPARRARPRHPRSPRAPPPGHAPDHAPPPRVAVAAPPGPVDHRAARRVALALPTGLNPRIPRVASAILARAPGVTEQAARVAAGRDRPAGSVGGVRRAAQEQDPGGVPAAVLRAHRGWDPLAPGLCQGEWELTVVARYGG